jgi:hypothetical protein
MTKRIVTPAKAGLYRAGLCVLFLLPMLGLAQPAPVTITLVRWPFT